jgi:hypothetical protein
MRKNKRYLSRDLKLQLRLSQGLLRKMGVIIAAELKADVKIVQAGLRMVLNGHQIGRYIRDNAHMPKELMCSINDVQDIGKGNKFVQSCLNRFIWGGLAKEKPDVVVVDGKRLVLFGYEIIYGTVEGKTLIIHRNGAAFNPIGWWFHELNRSTHKTRKEQMVMMVDSVLEIARFYDNTPGKWHYSPLDEYVVQIRDEKGQEWLVKNMVPIGVGGQYAGDIFDDSVKYTYPHKVEPLDLSGLPARSDVKIDWEGILAGRQSGKHSVDYFRQDLKSGGYRLDQTYNPSFSIQPSKNPVVQIDPKDYIFRPSFTMVLDADGKPVQGDSYELYMRHFLGDKKSLFEGRDGMRVEPVIRGGKVIAYSIVADEPGRPPVRPLFSDKDVIDPSEPVVSEIGLIRDGDGYVHVRCGGWPPEWMSDPKLGNFFKPNGQIDLIAVASGPGSKFAKTLDARRAETPIEQQQQPSTPKDLK